MKQEGLTERMELLEIGEKLGYPRLGYGHPTKVPHDRRIPPGQVEWEKFAAHAHVRRIYPALRVGRVLRDNGVEVFHPISSREAHVAQDGLEHRLGKPEDADSTSAVSSPADLLEDIVVDNSAPEIATPNTEAVVLIETQRRKRGGHKRPPHPNSKRNRSTAS